MLGKSSMFKDASRPISGLHPYPLMYCYFIPKVHTIKLFKLSLIIELSHCITHAKLYSQGREEFLPG